MNRHGRVWTDEELLQLRDLAKAGRTAKQIAAVMGRSYPAVKQFAADRKIKLRYGREPKNTTKPGMEKKQTTRRRCMNFSECGTWIESEHLGHRLCRRCRPRGDLAEGWEMVC